MLHSAGELLILTFLIRLYDVTAKDIACGFPGTPAYGYVKEDAAAYSEGDVVSYSCRIGYILLGSPISRCTEDGSWTEEVPICDDSMTTLGFAFSTPPVQGHSAEMAIDRDKETCSYLKPKKPRWWRIDLGNVHKVLSVAVTVISTDKNLRFTIFIIKTQESSASYKRCASFSGKFGTQTVVLLCAEGKGILGEKVHIEDHLPTEGLFEICEVEVQVEKDTGYDCGRPNRNLYSVTFEPRGHTVDYGCIRGYEIVGKDYRTCLSTGQWSGEPPVCKPIICDDLEPLENGKIELRERANDDLLLERSDGTLLEADEGILLEGAIASYKCNRGYKLIGTFTRECLNDGSWSKKTPHCKAIRCPVPDGRELGGVYRLLNKTTSMGSVAFLRCKRGKREGDNPYITCTEDAKWTEPEAHCILPAGASLERREEPIIVNQGVIIFGMVVAAVMIIVVLVALYLYTQKRRNADKPELPSRVAEPPVPPPRPPPRAKGGAFKSALMGLITRESDKQGDEKELKNSWKTQSLSSDHTLSNELSGTEKSKSLRDDKPALVEVEVLAEDNSRRNREENTSLKNVMLDMEGENKESSQKEPSGCEYAAVDYEKKRQSRLLKEQDSMESSSTAAASPLPPDDSEKKESRSPTPPKRLSESEEEIESSSEEKEDDQEEQRKKEEGERKAKEDAERKAKEEEERKAKEAAEKKESTAGRRRRRVEEPPPEEEKPVLRRMRRIQ